MSESKNEKLISGLVALNGISPEEAAGYVTLVGDNPEFTDETWVLVRDPSGDILTTLQWPADH